MTATERTHSSHWGHFDAIVEAGEITAARPYPGDPDPSPLLANIPGSTSHRARVTAPMIRAGWLADGPGPSSRRGSDPFVAVSWETAIELLSAELRRVLDARGPEAIYGGSYGWASAGRFHHAQSQIHRFLNLLGGYVASVNSYSTGAGEVILNRVAGKMTELFSRATSWPSIIEHGDLVVSFGGIPAKNATVNSGGVSRHNLRGYLASAVERGVEFVHFSPIRDDVAADARSTWHPIVPGADVAVMLALAHVLVVEKLVDRAFLDRFTTGFERFERYVLGLDDGTPKTPEWAEPLAQIPAGTIRHLARKMAGGRTLINISWSLQRVERGEQAPWMALTLAAMLGQIGLPGGGFGFGYGSVNSVGEPPLPYSLPTLPQGKNGVEAFIPVARISDMLLHPGETFEYNGARLTYPDIELVYWAGGNPFHHHQDLAKLRRALERPATIVVHEPFWTGTARHADIVLPSTVTLERNDIGASGSDPVLVTMRRALPPHAQSRTDYAIFSDLAHALGVGDAFTEQRDEAAWLRHLYEQWRGSISSKGVDAPDFETFWEQGSFALKRDPAVGALFDDFRNDPVRSPRGTPSGKIEIFSETIAGFGYDDCPGHPVWFEPEEWLGSPNTATFPLQLIANNPRTRLHSQLDTGAFSQGSKIQGREPARLNPADAGSRGIRDGDVIRIWNERGSCLAGAVLSDDLRPGVIQLSTGAWYDPLDPSDPTSMCVHGNPNVLTRDSGTSRLGQGCTGQHALVEIERWDQPLPPIRAYDPPMVLEHADGRLSGNSE